MNNNIKKISITTTCFNEEDNLQELYDRLIKALQQLPQYDYEIIVADNYSTDDSRDILRKIAAQNMKFKVIFNSRNFGHLRSPYNAFIQASGDAVIPMCSDLQDPPELIVDFIREWEKGANVVCAVKPQSRESLVMFVVRRFYYWLLAKFSETTQIRNFTGFGLYDRKFMTALKKFHDPYPYFRGIVSEIGLKRVVIPFVKSKRKHGRTKNNFFTLYDIAMTGFVNHTKLPLRLSAFCGFCLAILSLLIALAYFIYKLMFWETFNLGLAPLIIGLFFFSAVQLIFIGIIGEYIGAIYTHVKDKPLVIEEEKLNFDDQL
jgi:glycosyltransferase involved in cell wall biosynthesis